MPNNGLQVTPSDGPVGYSSNEPLSSTSLTRFRDFRATDFMQPSNATAVVVLKPFHSLRQHLFLHPVWVFHRPLFPRRRGIHPWHGEKATQGALAMRLSSFAWPRPCGGVVGANGPFTELLTVKMDSFVSNRSSPYDFEHSIDTQSKTADISSSACSRTYMHGKQLNVNGKKHASRVRGI